MAQLIELPGLNNPWILSSESFKPTVVFIPVTPHSGRKREENKESKVIRGYNKFPTILGYVRYCLKNAYVMKEDVAALHEKFCIKYNHRNTGGDILLLNRVSNSHQKWLLLISENNKHHYTDLICTDITDTSKL